MAIDDDEIATDIVRDMLQQFGFKDIQTASNGRSGLRKMDRMKQHPKLVIVDVFMPDMDGIEFVAELMKRKFAGGVILMSALDPQMLKLAQEIAVGSGLRVLAALPKPFQRSELFHALGLTADKVS